MKVLYLGTNSEGLGIPFKMEAENNTVRTFLSQKTPAGNGIVDKVDSWRKHISESDLVVSTASHFDQYEQVFLDMGKPVIGCSKFGSLLTTTKQDDFLNVCEIEKASPTDQRVFLTGFYNGRAWVEPLMLAVFNTRILQAGLGPDCGIVGVVLKSIPRIPDFMTRIGNNLKKAGIKDLVTVGVNEFGVFGLGCGLVPELIYCISEGSMDDLSNILFGVSKGITDGTGFGDDFVVGVKLTAPPFPYWIQKTVYPDVAKVRGIDDENLRHIFPTGLYKENGNYCAEPVHGNILFVTARGKNLRQAKRRVYRTLDNLKVKGKQYRIDVGATAEVLFELDFVKELLYGIR